jgi:hypothetical protein
VNEDKIKLTLVQDIVSALEKGGVTLTPNAVRSRLKASMLKLAEESCRALGVDMDAEQLERVSASRTFQEAVASVLVEADI